MVDALTQRLRRLSGSATPLGIFLVGTVVLALWLGYQALDAALSHRRTAEAVLSDYARISATEMAQVVDEEMDDLLEEVFEDVSPDRLRRAGLRSAEVLRGDMVDAVEIQRCDCPAFRRPIALFRITLDPPGLQTVPDTLPRAMTNAILAEVMQQSPIDREEDGLLVLPAGRTGSLPVGVGYSLPEDPDDPQVIYGFVVSLQALTELFEEWYEDEDLLPQPISGGQPNDSLLHVAVAHPVVGTIFDSQAGFPVRLSASVTSAPEYGELIVTAAVRPDAASQLIIGGLPRSRLPLLTLLLLLTLGVGIAAAVQLRREQKFQRLREDFVSGVSHELRTPLAQIRMFAELQQTGKLASPRDAARATFAIHREAVRLSHLVENILQFSRLRRLPEQHLPKERLDFAEALTDGMDAVTPLLEDRGMHLELSAQPELPVFANREAITRIVVNLLDNAVKYGPSGQSVVVRAERVNGAARFSVTDQGPGVPERDRNRVWNAYYRLARDQSSNIPGTGIGLSVVSDLVTLHGGRVWVENVVPSGARFVVELPLASANGGTTETEDEPEA